MVRRFLHLLLLLCVLFACSCNSKNGKSGYEIGIDPSWYPQQVAGQEKNILAFSIELLVEIAKREHLQLSIRHLNWNDLIQNLNEKKVDAVLTSLPRYNFNLKAYSFSNPYLMTGPVLIVPIDSKIKNLKMLQGKEIAAPSGSSAALLLESTPGILLRKVDSVAEALAYLLDQQYEAAAVDAIPAQDYLRNFYSGTLKIVSPPLDEEGLRLITLHNAYPKLIQKFNQGLAAFKKNGEYEKLLKKWGLAADGKPIADLEQQIEDYLNKIL